MLTHKFDPYTTVAIDTCQKCKAMAPIICGQCFDKGLTPLCQKCHTSSEDDYAIEQDDIDSNADQTNDLNQDR